MIRLLRRAALFLCVCFPLWALYLLLFQLRAPYGEQGQVDKLVALQNVEQMLRENMEDQVRHAEFREGTEAREERILKMRGVFEACISDLKKDSDGAERWIAMLSKSVELAQKGGKDREREAAELEMRVAAAVVLGEISQRVARIQNPPYEAFEAQRRQLIVILLVALAVILFPLAYLGYEEWREMAAEAAAPPLVTAAPWMEEAFQRFPEAVLAFDEGLRVRWANSAAERMLGYKPRELEGVSATAMFPASDNKGGHFSLTNSGGKLSQTARRRNGATFEATFQVVRAGARTLLLLREQAAEATERVMGPKLVDFQALREERDYFGDLLRAAPTPLMVLNRDGHIIRFNRAAEEMLEYSAGEVLGSPYWDLFLNENDRHHAGERWEDLKHEKGRQQVEETWRPRTQPELLLRWQRDVLLDANGQVRNVVAAAEPVVLAMAAAGSAGAGVADLSFDDGDLVQTSMPARVTMPLFGGSMEALEDRLTEVIGYAELALMAMPDAIDSRKDVERVKSAAEEAIGLWTRAQERERVERE
ncbi:MAG: PAS domain-containing protein [Acidobacteriota bacterium]